MEKRRWYNAKFLQTSSLEDSSFNVQIYTSMKSFQSLTVPYNCSKVNKKSSKQ